MFHVLNDECHENSIVNVYSSYNHDLNCVANSNSCRRKRVRRGKLSNSSSKKKRSTHIDVNVAFNNVNRVKSKIYDIKKFIVEQNIDIFGIAETFLKFEEGINVNGFRWYGKNRSCKGGGGVGFLVSDKLIVVDDDLCNSQSDDFERLWIRVKINDVFVNLAVVYFPVEGSNPDLVNEIYNQLLSEIIQIENESEDDVPYIMIMGDFNGRIGDNIVGGDPVLNSNGECLLNFSKDACLNIVNCSRKCYGKITWFRHPHSSCIDYVLSSDSIDKCIDKMIVDEERNFHLGSDHNVLVTYLKFKSNGNVFKNHDVKNRVWNITGDQDWSAYKNSISDHFDDWEVYLAGNPLSDVNTLWENWKEKLLSVANNVIGCKDIKRNCKQWWNKPIDDAIHERKRACKEHRRWTKHDKHNKERGDQLWDDYKLKKTRAKNLIQQKTMQARVERSTKIAQTGGQSSKEFWNELRGHKPRNNLTNLKLPDSDQITSDRNVMNSAIKHYWNTLGKMNRELNNCNDEYIHSRVNNIRRGNVIGTDQQPSSLLDDMQISADDVRDAISRAKNNKSPGIDCISNELLKNGGDSLIKSLTCIFNKFLSSEETPVDWNKGIIIPIYKKGNKNDLNNYRGITLTSCVSKIFNRIICDRIAAFLEDNQILSEVQGGFRKDHRCEDHIFTLKSIVASRSAENKPTYLAFLDFRKAFDTVWREGLLSVAWNIGIRGKVWNILDKLYNNVQCNVKFGDIVTDFFDIDEGVKQGCVLSPVLFCIYINELSKMLQAQNVGVHIFNSKICSLFWADDVVLIADSERDLKRMLSIAGDFSKDWKLDFNYDKSNIVVVGKRTNKKKLWPLSDRHITEVDSYKYLGFQITRNHSDHAHANDVIRKGNRLIGYIKSIINGQDDFNRVYYGNILWKTIALPSINYACPVSAYSASDYKRLENLQLQMARAILKAPRNTPSMSLLGDLGWDSIENTHNERKVKYFDRLINLEAYRWPKLLLNALFHLNDNDVRLRWKWLYSVKGVLINSGLDHIFSTDLPFNPLWFNSFKGINRELCNNDWYRNACSKSSLRDYVNLKKEPKLESYLLDKLDFDGSNLKFKARSNTLQLDAKVSIWDANNSGVCSLCNDGIEDIRHFLFICHKLQDVRSDEMRTLERKLCNSGLFFVWNIFILNNIEANLYLMLGGNCTQVMPMLPGNLADVVHIIFDEFCKSYLKKAWRVRSSIKSSPLT